MPIAKTSRRARKRRQRKSQPTPQLEQNAWDRPQYSRADLDRAERAAHNNAAAAATKEGGTRARVTDFTDMLGAMLANVPEGKTGMLSLGIGVQQGKALQATLKDMGY